MGRVVPVALIALLIVAGGLWLDSSRSRTEQAAGAIAQAAADEAARNRVVPGFRALPPLTEEPELTFGGAAPVLEEGLDYRAVIETSKGRLVIELFEQRAPRTVNNFVFLALHRYYEGVPFHRVLEDFMAQTGDPSGTGRGGPGYTFEDEIEPSLRHDERGTLSMANAGPDTNGSQFFITLVATPWLDGRHAVFGRLIEGDEVLSELQRIDPNTPSAVLRFDGTLAELAEAGVTLSGPPERSLQDHLEAELGAVPAVGQTFNIGGMTGVVGSVGGVPTAGFFPAPDSIESVTIVVAERGDEEESR
ncbi:MAG: peptidylprolyl isomerase [Trueperaceae bacterium]